MTNLGVKLENKVPIGEIINNLFKQFAKLRHFKH